MAQISTDEAAEFMATNARILLMRLLFQLTDQSAPSVKSARKYNNRYQLLIGIALILIISHRWHRFPQMRLLNLWPRMHEICNEAVYYFQLTNECAPSAKYARENIQFLQFNRVKLKHFSIIILSTLLK